MGLKLFGPGGIDQKSNDLLRKQDDLRDAQNIHYSINKEYEKRDGTIVDSNFSGDVYNDVIFIKSLDEYFFKDQGAYYSYKNGIKKIIPQGIYLDVNDNIGNISGSEYLNTFIFTHQENTIHTLKYDGNLVYMAGLPTPTISVTSQTGTVLPGFMLYFFDFIDNKGNQIFGPSNIVKTTNSQQNITVNTLKGSGFYNGYINTNVSTVLANYDLSYRTLTYTSKSFDIVAGSNVVFRTKNDGSYGASVIISDSNGNVSPYLYVVLTVESVTSTEIVFTESSFKNRIISILSSGNNNVLGNLAIRFYSSSDETTGYVQSGGTSLVVIDNNVTSINIYTILNSNGTSFLLSDTYDITTSKLRPPKCKYITAFGNQLVYGNVISFWNFKNEETTYTNNDLIMYSDISTGDLGENLSELNRQLIGDTYDGEITAMSRVKDSLIIFKNYSIYIIDGILSSGLYALRNILTNQIGCISAKSIISMEDYVMFQGQDGIYGINGYTSTIVSRKLDPYFLTIDPTKTKSVIDSINSNIIFITNIGAIVFNYEYKEWFIWTNIAALNGVTVDNQKQIKMFNGSVAKKFNTPPNGSLPSVINATKNDSGAAIDAYLKTAWIDLKEPSLLKKIIGIRFFALKNIGQVLTCRVYHDWDETKVKADFTVDFSTVSIKTILRKLDIQMAQSVSIFIGNNILNQDLRLNGYEVEIGLIQDKDKNVK